MKKLITFLLITIATTQLISQTNSRNGYWLHNTDTIRILLVFAEVSDYTTDVSPHSNWPKSKLPLNADSWFDADFTDEENIQGAITKYFYQASFGNFVVLGDYVDTLFSIDSASLSGNGDAQLIAFMNSLGATDLITKKGKSLNDDFDFVTIPGSGVFGAYKSRISDNYIDVLMPIWRTNKVISSSDGSGLTNTYPVTTAIKTNDGYMAITRCLDYTGERFGLARHEFGHTLFGGNDFHTCGPGFGEKTFINNTVGYSCMGSWDNTFDGFNAWDRNRIGWKQSADFYYIAALHPVSLTEVNTDFNYNDFFTSGTNGEFILRDFVTTGDAIRIKLPYLQADDPSVRDQYLWIENHQLLEGNIDIGTPSQKGMYAYIQVGKESLTTFSLGPNDYLWWLNAFGNYDVEMDTSNNEMNIDTELENPFTGFHLWTSPAIDLDGDDLIKRGEVLFPNGVKVDGVNLPESDFVSGEWPGYGTKYDAFLEGDKIGVSSNPSLSSILSYRSKSGADIDPYPTFQPGDNPIIRLNGISIEILEQQLDGDIKIKIRWNNYDVTQDTRWCGNIALHDSLYLKNNAVIKLDQGLTPTQPVNPIIFEGKKVFADTTLLTLRAGSGAILNNTSCLNTINNSQLIVNGSASLFMQDSSVINMQSKSALIAEASSNTTLTENSYIIIDDTSTFRIKTDANVILKNNAYIKIKNGGKLIIEPGNNLELQNYAKIIIEDGGILYLEGNDIFLNSTSATIQLNSGGIIQTADYVDFTFTGTGYLNYKAGGIFNLGTNSKFILSGTGTSDLKMWLFEDADLYIPNNDVEISDCKIQYQLNSKFRVAYNHTTFENVLCNDGGANATNALYAYETVNLFIDQTTFDGFYSSLRLENIAPCPDDINVQIENSTFLNFDYNAIDAFDVDRIKIYATSINGNTSASQGIWLQDVVECRVESSTIKNITNGIGTILFNVPYFVLDGSTIKSNINGIESYQSNIYLRNMATIKNNYKGIDAYSSIDGVINPTILCRITVGDIGCGWIINNSIGIRATDMFLDIDQIVHANASDNPLDMHPNRFDGNTTQAILMCYDHYPSADITNPIPATYNHWKTSGGPSNGTDYVIGFAPLCNDITLDATDYITTVPSNCNCIGSACDEEPSEADIALRLSETGCNVTIAKQGGGRITITQQYKDAMQLFSTNQFNYAYQKFNWIKNKVAAEYPNGLTG